jgi:dipeptidyl aminopeptidase/acylaminoacyl peptidase
MKRTACLFAILLAATCAFADKRAFSIEDLYKIRTVGDLAMSPDGKTLAFTIATSDLPRAKRSTAVWVVNSDGSGLHQVTRGEKDAAPHFAPDGKTLVFVRTNDGTPNLWILPLNGGESRQLTKVSTGVADPLWSPDGKLIAFSTDVYPECNGDDACNKKVSDRWSAGKVNAHMADKLLYRHWTAWKDGTVTHTWVVDVDSGKTRDLTPGAFDAPGFQLGGPLQYDFSPDSKELAVVSNHDAEPASSTNNDLWLVPVDGSAAPRNITASNPAFDGSPKYSPDGRYIGYRMQKQAGYESDRFRLALYDRKSGQSRVLTESFRNWIDEFDWSKDSKSLFFAGEVEGHNPIYRVAIDGGAIAKLYDDRTIDAYAISGDDRTIYYIGRAVGEPTELYAADLATPTTRRRLTHVNDAVTSEVDIRPAEVMWVPGADGVKVQVYIVKPHDFDPAKKYPLIVNVHGGPQSQWADAFRGDWQVYPGAGYIVAFPNPHGSTGFGQDYTAEISGDWGGKPYEDVMKVVDALEKLPYVDTNRIGAMGWSYGGYFMNWTEGHTTRFKAIASMMGLFDLRSMYGGTEELWFPEWDLKGQPWNSELYQKWSPSNYVQNFKTPCLVITGERDYRVPYTQSLQMFTALQKMHVPSKLIVYSNAGHWPSWYEMALYYTAHLEWFHQWLGGGAPPWTSEQFLRNEVFDVSTGNRVEPEVPQTQQNKEGKPDQKPVG